ncbi:MAG TPA: PfkB family carbohydrate kinase [Bacteroidia bacterium]|jgi:sugar/nucleoside kinase (ribokinase family)
MIKKVVEDFISRVSGLKVLVIGETIIDKFVYVKYEGPSMKSACQVLKLDLSRKEEVQEGGAAAIAGHLRDFVAKVDLVTNTGGEIVKTRYIESFDRKKHVEINRFDTEGFKDLEPDTSGYDVVIVADFGHGFCRLPGIKDGFHLMCQTNSNNFGYNRISKWKHQRKKSVCLDLREAGLQMNKSIIPSDDNDINKLFNYEINSENLFMTTGAEGALFTDGTKVIRQRSFPSTIVDTIGAGDTFYAFSCLLASAEGKIRDLTVPALAASLSTTWLCNERSVTKETLLAHAAQFV